MKIAPLLLCSLGLAVWAGGASAQTGCTARSLTYLLGTFSDSAGPATITPSNIRDFVCSALGTPASGPIVGLVAVPNNAALLTASTVNTPVVREGFSVSGDGGWAVYNLLSGPCSLNAGSGDNGSQVKAANGNCWIADFPPEGPSLNVWGNNAAALQAAVKWSSTTPGGTIRLPAGITTISTAIDGHNINHLTIKGAGCEKPAFGLANVAPNTGSILQANTGGALFDLVGSNNVKFENFCISAIGSSNPSTIGIIIGNSNGGQTGGPGGSGITLADVGVQMTNTGTSIPIYYNGAGLSGFYNIWTLGNYGLVLGSSNPLSVTPPFSTFGASIGTDGVVVSGSSFLGYGSQPPVYIADSNNFQMVKCYIDTINGGPSFSGSQYAMYLKNVIDAEIAIEEDFFPYLVFLTGQNDNVHITGSVFRGTTPVGATNPLIGFVDGPQLLNSSFYVEDSSGAVGLNNYWFTMNGVTPKVTAFSNNEFMFNSFVSNNTVFGNLVTGNQYFNIRINGTADGVTSFNINNSAAPATSIRAFMNGLRQGTL